MTNLLRRTGLAATLVLIGTLGLTACGSDNDSGSSGSGSGGDSAAAQEALQTAYDGVTGTPPTEATTPKPGVDLWVVSCGESIPSCSTPVAAVKEAAEVVGWTVKICDGQLSPDGWGSCVRQAVSAKADVIIPVGIDCAGIQQPFQEAKDAGVTVVGGGASDCDETGGEALWATERIQLQDTNAQGIWELSGKLAADWLIGKTDGKAQVLQTVFTDPLWGPWQAEGFTDEMATCADCDVVATLELANNDFVSGSANQKFSTALLQAPTADSVFVAVGGWMVQGFGQAIQSSGRSDQLNVISGFGDESNMDLIRSGTGGQDAVLGYATPWGGWGSVDEAIRVLNGEAPVVEGDGMQVVDADHNLPDSGDYTGGVDFKAAYEKAWGVSS